MRKYWPNKISLKKLLSTLFMLVPQISIFFLFRSVFLDQILLTASISQNWILSCKGIYLISLALFALFGSYSAQKIKRKNFFVISLLYRVLASVSIMFFQYGLSIFLPSFLLGSSYGFGFPSDQSFLADNTEEEERGRVAGITLCISFITLIILLMITSSYEFSILQNMFVIVTLQIASLGVLLTNSSWDVPSRSQISIKNIRNNKVFILYLIPWILFSFANGAGLFLANMVEYSEASGLATIIQYISSSIFFVVAGVIADYYGRKPTLLMGFVTLGLTYSLVPYMNNSMVDVLSSLFTGAAWSFIMVSFLFTIVGDISLEGYREIFFAINGTLWMVIETSLAFVANVISIPIPVNIISSLLSVSMFLSVIPLLYAPETLPSSKIVDRRISNYLQKVLKILEVKEE